MFAMALLFLKVSVPLEVDMPAVPCLHRLQKGLPQGLVCSFVGNHEEVQHHHQPYPSHQKPLGQGY